MMTAENIKTLIEAFQALGGDAKEAFLVWVVCDKGVPLLGILVCAVALYLIVRTIARAVLASQADTVALVEVGNLLGAPPSYGICSCQERRRIVEQARTIAACYSPSTTVTSCSCLADTHGVPVGIAEREKRKRGRPCKKSSHGGLDD